MRCARPIDARPAVYVICKCKHLKTDGRQAQGMFNVQYSPSNRAQSQSGGKVLRFDAREGLGEGVGRHLVHRAIDKFDRAGLNSVANKMITDVYVFGAGMIMSVFGKCDGRLTVGENGGGLIERREKLPNETTKPNSFLCGLRGCDVFGFSSRERNETLLL